MRLSSHLDGPSNATSDFVIVRSKEELLKATNAHFNNVMIVSDGGLEKLPEAVRCPRLISVLGKFKYLSDGDIIKFHPHSGRFRTLYRRESKHNSFLVTDRCNHYCLMCSQPPKDIDDRWILDELKVVLPLVAKDTASVCFTGGEPLLDWQEFIEVLALCREELPDRAIAKSW